MIQPLGPFPGEWCDIDYSPAGNGFVFARLERPGTIWLHDVHPDAIAAPGLVRAGYALGRWGLYLRCAADGQGNVCCVLQDGRDRNPATGQFYPAIVVLFPKDGPPREIPCPAGPAFGQNAVEVFRLSRGWQVMVVTSPSAAWTAVLRADGTWAPESAGTLFTWPATSQGFADAPQRMDDVRDSVPGMVCPSTADGLSIGQNTDGPDRIRGLYAGSYFTVLAGTAYEPHLASDGQGAWMACARTPQGAALVALAPPFESEQRPPEPVPDQPFVVDPHGVVEDIAEWLFSPNQGPDVTFSPDGNVRFYCKSPEVSAEGIAQGEHWDKDDQWIGHLDDASTGRRIYEGREVVHEDIVAVFPGNIHAAAKLWATLPLNHNWFMDGARLWLPRRCVTGQRFRYQTNIYWTVPPKETPTSNVWWGVPIEIHVDVGYGVIHGKEVRVRASYVPDPKKTGHEERSYYGPPRGYNAWIAGPVSWADDPWSAK